MTTTTNKTSEKKAYVMPEILKVKIKANSDWKRNTFSASGLVKFAKSDDGRKIIQPVIDLANKKHGTDFKVEKIDTRLFKQYGTEKELLLKSGEKKTLFSFWLLINLVNRKCKDMAAKAKVSTTAETRTIKKETEQTSKKDAA